MAPELHIRCLGRLNLHCQVGPELAARELPLPATLKAQSLLAYLVTRRDRAQGRDHLAELFWGDRPERNARRSLTTALWQIRRCLPNDAYLLTTTTGVQFNSQCPFWLDIAEFEKLVSAAPDPADRPAAHIAALQDAVEIYRGSFLEGFYDDWVLTERYRLENLYHDALAQLIAAREALGEHEAALAAALRLVEYDPLREDAHRAAMRAYCRLGQRHAALAQYGRCQQVMQAELGAEPMAETVALRQAILEGRFACEPSRLAVPITVAAPRRELARNPLDAAGQIPLVGREQELAFLAEAWGAALRGGCSLLLVSGEAGVGKTRLVQEFADQQRWQGVRVLEGRCYEFERLLPYQPVAEALRALPVTVATTVAANLPEWIAAQVNRLAPEIFEQVSHSLSATAHEKPSAWIRGFSRSDGRHEKPAEASSPELQATGSGVPPVLPGSHSTSQGEEQERLFAGVSHFLAHLADQSPLLLILEDLHWATDSTLQLLHYLARDLSDQPVLIVGTLRPEAVRAAHPVAALGRRLERDRLARRLQLAPLSAAAVATLIGQLSGDGEAAGVLADQLYRETEGNPFYLIETVKALFEQGAIRVEGDTWRTDFAVLARDKLPLPASVSEMITARVGRLPAEAQEAAQVAAVAGREFDFDLLNAAWGRGEEATLAALDDLLRHRLVAEAVGAADYAFTHHTIQEAVYAGLARQRRLRLHGRVGLALEAGLGAEAGTRAVELAYHFEQARQVDAGLTDKAIAYLLQAGRQSEHQWANQEALGYYRRGLDILRSLPDMPERLQREVELQIALAVPTTAIHGYGSPEARDVYGRARDLSRQLGETPALFASLAGLARHYGIAGDARTGLEIGKRLLTIAQAAQETDLLLEAYRQMGGPSFGLGRLKEARGFWERGIALYDPAQHERLAYRFGHDPAVTFHGYLSLTLWLLGYPEQALGQGQRLCGLIQSFVHPTSLTIAQCLLAKQACVRGDVQVARQHAEEAIRLGQAHVVPTWTAMGAALRGWALVEQGHGAEGLVQLNKGITAFRATGVAHFVPLFLALQAEACLKTDRPNEGLAALAEARPLTQNGGDTYWLAEVDRLRGELIRIQEEDESKAETLFRSALETARQQEARMLELRAAMSLARLWQAQGKAQTGRELLTEIYDWFTEGFDTPDLQAASALLAEL